MLGEYRHYGNPPLNGIPQVVDLFRHNKKNLYRAAPFLPLLSVVRHTLFLVRGSRVTAYSPCSTCQARRFIACPMWISARSQASSFPTILSRLNHFNLTAYRLSTSYPTLNLRGYPLRSKDSLLGGWLDRISHQ